MEWITTQYQDSNSCKFCVKIALGLYKVHMLSARLSGINKTLTKNLLTGKKRCL